MQELKAGEQVFDGRYKLINVVGRGGLGTVYKALQLDLNRSVAIKVLCAELSQDEEFRKRFQREAQAMCKITHPNIVTIYHFGFTQADKAYIAMEFIEGKSGRLLLSELGRLPTLRALNIIREAAGALDFVHKQDLVHRDLKPENLLIVEGKESDQVKIIDFGLVRHAESDKQHLTRTGELIGTVHYMSPEQCKGAKADARSDIYSLGACLYEFLTGEKVFDADTGIGIMYKHLNETVPSLTAEKVQRFCPALNELLRLSLEKDPSKRFQSMEAFAQAINDAAEELAGYELSSKTDSTPKRCLALVMLIATIIIMAKSYKQTSLLPLSKKDAPSKIQSKLAPATTVHIPTHEAELVKLLQTYQFLGPETELVILNRWTKQHERNSTQEDRALVACKFVENYARSGKEKEAEFYVAKLLAQPRIQFLPFYAVTELAKMYRLKRQPEKAIESINRAKSPLLFADISDAEMPIFMFEEEAKAYEEMNQRAKAESVLRSILSMLKKRGELKAEDNGARYLLISYFAREGRTAELTQLADQCLEASENDPLTNSPKALATVYMALASNLQQNSTEQLSTEYYKKAVDLFAKTDDKNEAAQCLVKISQMYYRRRDFDKLEALYKDESIYLAQPERRLEVLLNMAQCAAELEKKDKSIFYANESIKLCQHKLESGHLDFASSDGITFIGYIAQTCNILNSAGKSQEAEAILERWRSAIGKSPKEQVAQALIDQALITTYLTQHQTDRALKCIQEELELFSNNEIRKAATELWSSPERFLEQAYLSKAEILDRKKENEDAAIASALKTKSLLDNDRDHSDRAQLSMYVRAGRIIGFGARKQEAEDCYAKAESLIKELDKRGDISAPEWMLVIAESRRENKNFAESRKILQETRDKLISSGQKKSNLMRHCLVELANLYDSEKQTDEARECMLEAMQCSQPPGVVDYYQSRACDFLGQYSLDKRNFKAAEEYFKSMLQCCPPEQMKFAYYHLTETYETANDINSAIKVAQQGLARIKHTTACTALDQDILLRRLGQLYGRAGKLANARAALLEANRLATEIKDDERQMNEELGGNSAGLADIAALEGNINEQCEHLKAAAILFGKSRNSAAQKSALNELLKLSKKADRTADIDFASRELNTIK